MKLNAKKLGYRLADIRNEKGMTMLQAAIACGYTGTPSIAAFESAYRTPTLRTLARIASGYGVKVSEIVTDDLFEE